MDEMILGEIANFSQLGEREEEEKEVEERRVRTAEHCFRLEFL